ncbi:PEPxxWA-CTERM sorting domain-containing protein [Sphingomonas changnyeongensis]|uniref:PEPxxWA-CTERM sorting domain-containing protein n=1 Tax=Sphingomonas changnyeongensis TaxID=2698679 RepID=A0A7Z2NXG7_9SPHN|nr:PEPxxWA-CTERM sorting domain-containing protein [Sphingomonas changnyeongensis]QHL91209.1 PEPxxWA-CTERM sorting domain-containing protein [Sphingomonas changnyeongensis]
MKKLFLAATAAIAIAAAAPADAATLIFTITNIGGEDRGDFSFTLDTSRVPDLVLTDSVRYTSGIQVSYRDVPGAGTGVATTGLSFFTGRQQGGLSLGASGWLPIGTLRLLNTALITNASFNTALPRGQNLPVFRLGTFDVSTTAQNSGPRPFDNYRITIAEVPEPATWAMMVIGFGAAGYGLRRRRVAYTLA